MNIRSLVVVHQLKSPLKGITVAKGQDLDWSTTQGFVLDSCQRKLLVTTESRLKRPFLQAALLPSRTFYNVIQGIQAYLFLLRVATGLESKIVGETDIFGQLKEAWFSAEKSMPADLHFELHPWMQHLFMDTKEIRSQYLQNLGGASYGSLVRKLLKGETKSDSAVTGPILVIGAGQLAHSVVPFLELEENSEIWLWNRSQEKLAAFRDELLTYFPANKIRILSSEDEKNQAWREAAHAVLCVPPDDAQERKRSKLWHAGSLGGRKKGAIVHLGGYRYQCEGWDETPGFYSLENLFELQKSQNDVRSIKIARSMRACEERAKLRGLGTCLTIPHGWEDLAMFA